MGGGCWRGGLLDSTKEEKKDRNRTDVMKRVYGLDNPMHHEAGVALLISWIERCVAGHRLLRNISC